jgi:spoIIIJ-associated protein
MQSEKIKALIENTVRDMGILIDSIEDSLDPESGKTTFVIKTQDSGLLIGEHGDTFYSLNHVLKRMAEKIDPEYNFSIDVNDYQKSQIEKLKLKAKILANRARDMKASIEMDPMTSYERLIVHGALTDEPNISTESTGEGRERRIIIKYVESL